MTTPSAFPDDRHGARWQQLFDAGDDASQPRVVDFWHVFPERKQALHFAAMIDDRELEVSISYYRERGMWQTVVKRFMVPAEQDIAALERSLATHARSVGGLADGWDDTPLSHPDI